MGTIGTGDAPLGQAPVRTDFVKLYKSELRNIDTIVVPHHGAAPKSPPKFYSRDILGSATWAVMSAGSTNSYGHPSSKVINDIYLARRLPVVVSEHTWPGFTQLAIADLK